MKSMTGFGRAAADSGSYSVTIEIRSVNSRFCEVGLRSPRSLSAHEAEIQSAVKKRFDRGRFSVHVSVERTTEATPDIAIDRARAARYVELLGELRALTNSDQPIGLDEIIGLPGIFVQRNGDEDDEEEEEVWPLVQSVLGDAMDQLETMRTAEGAALDADLRANAARLEELCGEVEAVASTRAEEARERLRQRVDAVLENTQLDPARLEQEIALLADKLDISEELVRLRSHLELYRETVDSTGPVGRKLNFIAQEINREINTIGSKANDAEVAHVVVSMKEALEKIREQVENVE